MFEPHLRSFSYKKTIVASPGWQLAGVDIPEIVGYIQTVQNEYIGYINGNG